MQCGSFLRTAKQMGPMFLLVHAFGIHKHALHHLRTITQDQWSSQTHHCHTDPSPKAHHHSHRPIITQTYHQRPVATWSHCHAAPLPQTDRTKQRWQVTKETHMRRNLVYQKHTGTATSQMAQSGPLQCDFLLEGKVNVVEVTNFYSTAPWGVWAWAWATIPQPHVSKQTAMLNFQADKKWEDGWEHSCLANLQFSACWNVSFIEEIQLAKQHPCQPHLTAFLDCPVQWETKQC